MNLQRMFRCINRLRKPQGVIRCEDGQWLVKHIRFEGCGIIQGDTNVMIKAFTDDKANVCITVPNFEDIGKLSIQYCEFKGTINEQGS